MKDFSHINGAHCEVSSPYERAGIYEHLRSLGVEITGPSWRDRLTDSVEKFPFITFDQGKIKQSQIGGCSTLKPTEFVALFEAPALPKIGDWQPTIIVDRKTLKVAGLDIPFSTVEAIYKAMKP